MRLQFQSQVTFPLMCMDCVIYIYFLQVLMLAFFFFLQVYVINVTYSDNTSHIIYRRYSKFFDLQVNRPMMMCGLHLHHIPNFTEVYSFWSMSTRGTFWTYIFFAPVLCQHVCAHVMHTSLPRWINVCVSNWSGSGGDKVCIPLPGRGSAICFNSPLLSPLYCLYFYPTVYATLPSSFLSSLPHPQNVKELTSHFFMVQARNPEGSQFTIPSFIVHVYTLPCLGYSDSGLLYKITL